VSNLVPDPAAMPPQTARLLNVANGITVLRLLLVPVFAAALLHADGNATGWRILATVIFAVASITDRIDGDLARRRGLVTEFGKLADPIADKALTGTALVGLSSLGLLPWWVTVVILVREIGVTLLRFWVIRHGVLPASRGGKLKTLVQAVAIGLYVLPLSDWLATLAAIAMGAAVLLTVATGVDYVARALTLRRTSARAVRKRQARLDRLAGPTHPADPGHPAELDRPAELDHPVSPGRPAGAGRAVGQRSSVGPPVPPAVPPAPAPDTQPGPPPGTPMPDDRSVPSP